MTNYEPFRESDPAYDERYLKSQTIEPLSGDMVRLLRRELEDIFYEQAVKERRLTNTFKLGWRSESSWSEFDRWSLDKQKLFAKKGGFPGGLTEFANKEVAVYFEAQGHILGCNEQKLGRYIFREWLRINGGRPPLQRHHYFAKNMWFDKKCRHRPQNIPEISSFHKSFCDGISESLDERVTICSAYSGGRFTADPSSIAQSWREHGFALGHVFRSLFMVVDDQVLADLKPPPHWAQLPHRDSFYHRDSFHLRERILEWSASQYTVLLVKTGDDAHLSAPVSFQSLYDSVQALPVNRKDLTMDNRSIEDDVVRVRIGVAVQFVFDLLRREQKALPHVWQAAEELQEELRQGCEQWIDRVLDHAQQVGIDTNGFTWKAIRRAQARLNGEAFELDQVAPYWEYLHSWFL